MKHLIGLLNSGLHGSNREYTVNTFFQYDVQKIRMQMNFVVNINYNLDVEE